MKARFDAAGGRPAGEGLGRFLLRALAGTGAVRICAMLASFLVGIQLARGLGVQGYGYYGIALSILTIAGLPAELGLPALVTREVARSSASGDLPNVFGVLRWANGIALRIAAPVVACLIVIGIVLIATGSTVVGTALLLGSPIVPLTVAMRIRGGALGGLHRIVRGQIPDNLVRPLVFSLLLFAASAFQLSVRPPQAMALGVIAAAVGLVFALVWLRRALPKREHPSAEGNRSWLRSTIPLALIDGMRMLQLELTTVLLGLMTIPVDVGLFRIAVVTSAVAAAPQAVINQTMMPVIARLHQQGDRGQLQTIVTWAAWAQTAGVLLLSLPLLLAPAFLLSLVFGSGYAAASDALRLLVIGQVVGCAFGVNVVLLNMTHHERSVTRAMAIGLVLNVIFVLALGRTLGALGAAIGFVASLLCWNALTWRDSKRLLAVDTSVLRWPVARS